MKEVVTLWIAGKLLNISIDELVSGSVKERIEKNIAYRELLKIFQRVQNLEAPQLAVVKDVVSAYLLKTDLQKNLIAK